MQRHSWDINETCLNHSNVADTLWHSCRLSDIKVWALLLARENLGSDERHICLPSSLLIIHKNNWPGLKKPQCHSQFETTKFMNLFFIIRSLPSSDTLFKTISILSCFFSPFLPRLPLFLTSGKCLWPSAVRDPRGKNKVIFSWPNPRRCCHHGKQSVSVPGSVVRRQPGIHMGTRTQQNINEGSFNWATQTHTQSNLIRKPNCIATCNKPLSTTACFWPTYSYNSPGSTFFRTGRVT